MQNRRVVTGRRMELRRAQKSVCVCRKNSVTESFVQSGSSSVYAELWNLTVFVE